jgi:hypothetical protein
MRFTAKLHGRDIDGIVVNAGEWLGNVYIIEIGLGNGSFFRAVEADNESDAIDAIVDDEVHGAYLRMVDTDIPDDEKTYAGNASEQVDLENVMIYREHITDLVYLIGNDPTLALTPAEHMDTCVWDQH